MNYIILYGSESDLIKDLFPPSLENKIIRIHGQKVPSVSEYEVLISGSAIDMIQKVLDALSSVKKGDRIIFIGAAFVPDESLLVTLNSEKITKILDLNINSYVNLVAAIIPVMVKIRSGNFIYLSSFRAVNTTKGALLYSASKAFGESLFVGIAREYGRLGVMSHVLRMGYFNGRILSSIDKDDKLKQVAARNALRRLGEKEDLMRAINYCLGAPFSTGGVIDLDGGLDFL
jgi:NAD(P)-dependent dehydrogenase (short-subunit alcohol dehydrogenase family)